jgi:hypothetical protein
MIDPDNLPAVITASSLALAVVCREVRVTVDWLWPDRRTKHSPKKVKKRKR